MRRGRAPHLYDASSLIDLLLTQRGKAADALVDGRVLDLTLYEVGNALRRLCQVEHRLTRAQLHAIWRQVVKLTGVLEVIQVGSLDLEEIMITALKRNIPFYDAAYHVAAARFKLSLQSRNRVHR